MDDWYVAVQLNSKYTPYLALTGELWKVFLEIFGVKWPQYIERELYLRVFLPHTFPKLVADLACGESKEWLRWVENMIRILIMYSDLLQCGIGCKYKNMSHYSNIWWRHQMEAFSALLALCAGNSPVTGELPSQRPVTRKLMFSLICAWTNVWANNQDTIDLRRHHVHYEVTGMKNS